MTTEELSKLTPEQKRIRIAELCGKLQHEWSELPGDVPCIGFIPQCQFCMIRADESGADEPCILKDAPDYLNDLNAMHEAEKSVILTEDLSKDGPSNRFYKILEGIAQEPVCFASAAEHADAFLLTLA